MPEELDGSLSTQNRLPENAFGLKVAIEEMKFRLSEVYGSVSAYKNLGQQIFGSASLIVGMGGALQVFNVQVAEPYRVGFNLVIMSAMILYVWLIIVCLQLLLPRAVYGPTPSTIKILETRFIYVEEDIDILRQLLANYINAIELSEKAIPPRKRQAQIAAWLLVAIVLLLIGASLFPRTLI